MINLFKYRKLAILILIILIMSFLCTLIAFWNLVLVNDIKNEGWLMILFTMLFVAGLAFFLLNYYLTDQEKLNNYVEFIISKDKAVVSEAANEQRVTAAIIDKTVYEDLSAEIGRKAASANDLGTLCDTLLKSLSDNIGLVKGIMYVRDRNSKLFNPTGYFAFSGDQPDPFIEGEGIAGQAAADRTPVRINDIPSDYSVTSGLGDARPVNILFYPMLNDAEPVALLELGFFKKPGRETEELIAHFSAEAVKLIDNYFTRLS